MNYGLAFVFSYECFENALICIISIGPSIRLRPILNFPVTGIQAMESYVMIHVMM